MCLGRTTVVLQGAQQGVGVRSGAAGVRPAQVAPAVDERGGIEAVHGIAVGGDGVLEGERATVKDGGAAPSIAREGSVGHCHPAVTEDAASAM